MKEALIDTSENHVGIVLAEGLVITTLTKELKKEFGNPIHMNELKPGEKFKVLRVFNRVFRDKGFSKKLVEIYCFEVSGAGFWRELVEGLIERKVNDMNVDYEVHESLTKYVNGFLLRTLNIYTNKETIQFADIVAYGNSHHNLVKNIWKNVPMKAWS